MRFLCVLIAIWTGIGGVIAQNGLRFSLDRDNEDRYIVFKGLGQIWLRHTDLNPGSTINGYEVGDYSDISIRRLRFQVYGQITDKVFFYTQFGQNNFNFMSPKFTGSFFHDATLEYHLDKKLHLGTGLTAWNGLLRHSSPSIGSIMSLDAPLYLQATNGVNDQFLRKLSVYAKGQLGRLDYRLILTQPMDLIGGTSTATSPTETDFTFSNEPPKKQVHGYFKYMFEDIESNLLPYEKGTYLGGKNVINLGAGFLYQPDALWALDQGGNVIREDMLLYGVDFFLDRKVTASNILTTYLALSNYELGSGYIRNVGVDGFADSGSGNAGGPGNAFPMIGNGTTFYGQLGYLLSSLVLGEDGIFQPFIASQWSDYDFLSDPMWMYEIGANYLIHGAHGQKISVVYQSRPTFSSENNEAVFTTRKGMTVLQYQVTF